MWRKLMPDFSKITHPYIPNAVPSIKKAMLAALNANSVDEFYQDIPGNLRFKGKLNLPEPLLSEAALVRHVEALLAKNTSARECLSFLGGGCWQHHVPALCDEINSRGEFLTAYAGEPYEDKGRFQALFEYQSMMGELLNVDVVNVPTYDGFQAAATALLMAGRITARSQVLLCSTLNPDLLSKIRDYVRPHLDLVLLPYDPASGLLNLDVLKSTISQETAAVFFENPSYLGFIETQAAEIAAIAHHHGALCVVYADPISLGVLSPPADYGGDIACGDIQPLGIHMLYGGGHGGYIATHDDPKFVLEYPSRLFGVTSTTVEGEYGFGDVAYERTSFALREEGKEWVGTAAALWGITAGVYLALMGPQGMLEIGEGLLRRTAYAIERLGQIPGLAARFSGLHFKEFVLDFNHTGQTVAAVQQQLLKRGIFGGKDLSLEFPQLGQCALYAVTEIHTQADMDRLVATLQEVLA
jgi:glycine dehydrogenase subunit 1